MSAAHLMAIDAGSLLSRLTDEPQSQVKLARLLGWLRGPDSNGHMRADRRRVGRAADRLRKEFKCVMCGSDDIGRTQTRYRRQAGCE